MQRFYANEKKRLAGLLTVLSTVFESFQNAALDFNTQLELFLNQALVVYKELGYTDKETRIQSAKAEMALALRGTNPMTFSKQTQFKREMQQTVAFKILQSCETLLTSDFTFIEEKLNQAEELVGQILLTAYQLQLIPPEIINTDSRSTALISSFWEELSQNENIKLGQKRLLFNISIYDIYLMVDLLLDNFGAVKPE